MEGSQAARRLLRDVEGDYYSAPHIHRHKKLRIKITENQVEIFLGLERLAIHPRSRHRNGRRIMIDAHFPPASQAYYEATPQKLLSQSRFIHPELNQLFVELFNTDVYGNIRRCQGFVRSCTKEINQSGHELASERIAAAIATHAPLRQVPRAVLPGAARPGAQTGP